MRPLTQLIKEGVVDPTKLHDDELAAMLNVTSQGSPSKPGAFITGMMDTFIATKGVARKAANKVVDGFQTIGTTISEAKEEEVIHTKQERCRQAKIYKGTLSGLYDAGDITKDEFNKGIEECNKTITENQY